ncbi:MAG TPA: L,D-transpeptidase family protein [Methylocella sp.]|nr:L,D-transpeptidase family protein [Methylocella sp.]
MRALSQLVERGIGPILAVALGLAGPPARAQEAPPEPAEDVAAPQEVTPSPAKASPQDAAAPQELPAVNAALKSLLEARAPAPNVPGLPHSKEREAIAAFYAARGFAPIWWTDGQPSIEVASILARLEHASEDGLGIKYAPPSLSPTDDASIAGADVTLTDAVVAYGRQATGSRVDPRVISRLIGEEPHVADPADILARVASAGILAGDELQKFNPPQKAYAALRQKLMQLRRGRGLAAAGPPIPPGPVLRLGMRDPRVPLLRARLNVEDTERDEDSIYDASTAAAVAEFQRANGLPPTGHLTARTVAALSRTQASAPLEAEIIANMERWRWMPRDLGESHIDVNIPDYEAVIIDKGEVIERTRVVVGKEETPTPIFSNTMKFLIVNPYWNVPPSIIRKEMLPKLAADPHYLSRLGYEVFSRNGQLVVRQPPGERNALGRIKFMFPNDFSVYLHDTPMRKLFAESKRAFSHGCVRVDDPFRFAQIVLGQGWSEERVKKLIGGKERYVFLPKPLPVHLEYFTAYVDDTGALQLRDDVYGYSRKVREALGFNG